MLSGNGYNFTFSNSGAPPGRGGQLRRCDGRNIYITNNSSVAGRSVIQIYARTGAYLGELNGSAIRTEPSLAPLRRWYVCTIPDGRRGRSPWRRLRVGGSLEKIYSYDPSATNHTDGTYYYPTEADYTATLRTNFGYDAEFAETDFLPGGLAADSHGNVYVAKVYGIPITTGGIYKFRASEFDGNPHAGTLVDPVGQSLYIDPLDDYLYTNDLNTIREYTPSGVLHGTFGTDEIGTRANSRGLAVYGSADGTSTVIYAPDRQTGKTGTKTIYRFGTTLNPDPRMQSPLVVDSVNDGDIRYADDFQVTPDGRFAVLATTWFSRIMTTVDSRSSIDMTPKDIRLRAFRATRPASGQSDLPQWPRRGSV